MEATNAVEHGRSFTSGRLLARKDLGHEKGTELLGRSCEARRISIPLGPWIQAVFPQPKEG